MKMYVTKNSLFLIGPIQDVLDKLRKMAEHDLLVKEKISKLLH